MASRQKLQVDITATDKTKAAFNSLNRSLSNTGRTVNTLKKSLGGLTAAIGGQQVVAALTRIGQQVRQFDLLSKRIGDSATALSEFALAAAQAGVQMSSSTIALQRQTRRIGEAAQGYGEASKAIKQLGLDAADLARLSPTEAFYRLSDALMEIENDSVRIATAFKLWDTEGVALLQTLDELDEARRRVRQTGALVTATEVVTVKELSVAFDTLKLSLVGIGQDLITIFGPTIRDAIDLTALAVQGVAIALKFVALGAAGTIAAFSGAWDLLTNKGENLGQVMKELNAFADALFSPEAAEQAASGFQKINDALPKKDQFEAYLQGMRNQNEVLAQQAAGNYEIAASIKAVQAAEKAAGVGRHGLDPAQVASVQELSKAQQGFKETIAANEKALRRQEQFADQVAATMTSAFADAVIESEKLSDVFDALLKDLAQMVLRMAVLQPLAQGISSGISPFLPKFASGTNYAPGGLAVVGERGAELVNLPRGSQVIPNHKLGTGGGTTVNVINAPPDARVERQQQSDGSEIVNVILAEVARDVANGGQVSRSIQGTFGSRQQAVMR